MTLMQDNNNDHVEIDPNKSYFELLTGEGGKFHDPDPEKAKEKIARGKYEADVHINTLEQRMDEMREDNLRMREQLNAVPRINELLDQFKSNPTSREDNHNSNEGVNKTAIDPQEIRSLFKDEISQYERERQETNNYRTVENKLIERFGDNYKSVISNQAKALGLSAQEVDSMAKTNPKLFFKTFDVESRQNNQNFQTPPNNALGSNFAPRTEKRTKSYYEKLRKDNPRLYFDPKIAVQMDKDAIALGKEFFDV